MKLNHNLFAVIADNFTIFLLLKKRKTNFNETFSSQQV